MTRERSLLCPAWEVRAFLSGRKTQFRREVKPQPDHFHRNIIGKTKPYRQEDWDRLLPQIGDKQIEPPYCVGDRIWVPEKWCPCRHGSWEPIDGSLRANGYDRSIPWTFAVQYCDGRADHGYDGHWRSAVHMPRWASRITREVTAVRMERLNEISESDAVAEGFGPRQARTLFLGNWSVINGIESRDANPWAWVTEVREVQG